MLESIGTFIRRSVRVLRVSYRPKADEFWLIAKVTGLGMALIGAVGFLITILFTYINQA